MALTCPVEVQLSEKESDAFDNKKAIEAITNFGGHARIPKGTWPVEPIDMKDNSRISACGIGVSQLYLYIENPTNTDPQHVIATIKKTEPPTFTFRVTVNDITLNGNQSNINWNNVTNDGNAYGLWARSCIDSMFYNIAIKDCWTDGLQISATFTPNQPADGFSQNCQFESFNIKNCGRQGVSFVGANRIVLNDFVIEDIGRVTTFDKSPRAGIDIEPGGGIPTGQLRGDDICISNVVIKSCGQGIIMTGKRAEMEPEDRIKSVAVSNVTCEDIKPPVAGQPSQLFAAELIDGITLNNFTARDSGPTSVGLGVRFRSCSGTATNISLFNIVGTNFPLFIDGDTELLVSNVLVDGADRGAIQIGSEPNDPAKDTNVSLSSFRFLDVARVTGQTGLRSLRVNSNGKVRLLDGIIEGTTANQTHAVQLTTDAEFENCDFFKGITNRFLSSTGSAIGLTNIWNKSVEVFGTPTFVEYDTAFNVTIATATLTIQDVAKWNGNEILIRAANSSPNLSIAFQSGKVNGVVTSSISFASPFGLLSIRTNGVDWFTSTSLP